MKLTFLYNAVCAIRKVKCKFLLVLKLITIMLLVGVMHVSAASYAQTVSLYGKNKSLETVFKEIKQQTGYLFFYNEKVNIKGKTANLNVKNVPLAEALDICLKDNGLSFTIIDKTIVIQNKVAEEKTGNIINKVQVSGQIVDSVSKATVPGVNISLKGSKGIIGQSNGMGEFSVMADPGQTLVFTFIGYKSAEIKVTAAAVITVKLLPDINNIKDVVVTGYQVIKKDNYTGNAITVSGADLIRNNPQNLIKSIQSFDPSFKVLDDNLIGSDPNKLPKINVRGATAIPSINDDILNRNNLSSNYNLPAFILDGFEVSLQKVVDLDINRIESVTLLKDGAATAVYGSRAANGVMVITTKAPVAGRLQLSYNYQLTFNGPDLSDYHVLNAKQKIDYEQLVGLYSASTSSSGDTKQADLDAQLFTRLKNVASGVNTYWLSQPLRNAYQQKHTVYAQGGDQSFRYGIDLRYQTQPGVMKGSDNTRYSGGVDFTYNPNSRLIIRNDLTITQVNQANSPYGNFATYVNANPYFPMRDSTGALLQELANWRINTGRQGNDQYITENVFNPLYEASLSSFDKSAYTEILESFSADYKITTGLRFKALMSVNKTNSSADHYVSPLSNAFYNTPTDKLNNRGTYDYANNNNLNLDGSTTINYNRQIGDHFFNLVLGANIIAAKSDAKSFSAEGFSNDRFSNIGFARIYKENSGPGGNVIKSRTAGSFFSGNYSYKNRYLLDVSARVDGSSAFGADKRFAPFWSVGAGWNAHQEAFLKGSDVISQLRLKGSIATLGSISFPAYQSRSIYQYQTSNWYSTGIGATILGYGNSNLEWQKTKTYDAGIDLGLFNDRIVISPRYYYKLTRGLITDINLAPSTGFSTYKDNLGDMSNKGYELYLVANVFRTKDWNVNLTGNLAHNVNRIVHISDALKAFNSNIDNFQTNTDNNAFSIPLTRYVEGKSLNTIYAVKSLGIDPENGKEILVKKDGTLTYTWDVKDIQDVGNTTPKAEGFFGSTVTYKRFMLSFSFHYRFGGQAFNQTLIDRVENADPRFNVDSRVLEQRWKQPGDHTFFKNIADLSDTYVSSRFVQKDNLIELQSLYLSYDFNPKSIHRFGLQNLRFAATANDIFRASTIEVERGINYPFARSLTVSIQGSF
ncbi:SusC/RagA family TonB-linked outer membrane protein [Mucilaginibacter sp. OK283]|uniref:SusC/RagA family TonB-linked outer membrane protein n=1 Tax=Mucilaginibacter sp. OK283 TaxID=1881049 RepID=UPI0008C97A67|nr:SusC/RagA family TonB-linked outer membrane protein [Mucilaginibacter sp. OK283]SEP41504.1 TonB-linked outer membrane protein, SusC/RagA family [Mucilaginibacter sp. OK283]